MTRKLGERGETGPREPRRRHWGPGNRGDEEGMVGSRNRGRTKQKQRQGRAGSRERVKLADWMRERSVEPMTVGRNMAGPCRVHT